MDDSPYLTPAELDFRRDPSVTALGDGRYVVATDPPDDAAKTPDGDSDAAGRPDAPSARPTGELDTDGGVAVADPGAVTNEAGSVAAESAKADATDESPEYFLDVAARTDEGEFDARFESDDIGVVCAAMLRWYARRVSPEDDPKKVLSVVLSRSEFAL
ncbi:hypothetical protein [Halogeometricum sp. CBA1124]|uniref:DUF7500 family protein n=1 Tax=Halogeometricum sp. CBA1124 TaxID=2668071 RepID=UPI00142A4ACE|nr:hypothetical protein [Halogeometricum sp. CBA1124]MUV58789.1 hypothetical protein [Halogeometricum sp. CBA1124]